MKPTPSGKGQRHRTTPQERLAWGQRFERSGLSRGEFAQRHERRRSTLDLLQASLRAKPNAAAALGYLGISLVQTKDVAKGKEQLQKAITAGLKEPLLTEAKRALAAPPAK